MRGRFKRQKLPINLRQDAPAWATKSYAQHQVRSCCSGWLRLSARAILVFCNDEWHMPRERVGRGMPTAFILKRFGGGREAHQVKRYNMRFNRALSGKKPRPLNKATVGTAWSGAAMTWVSVYERDRDFYSRFPLTDEEWMYATALMYFLGRN